MITPVQLITAFEQKVSVAPRDWPEIARIEKAGFQGWVPIYDAELDVVAMAPAAIAPILVEIMNRFVPDPHPEVLDEDPDPDTIE